MTSPGNTGAMTWVAGLAALSLFIAAPWFLPPWIIFLLTIAIAKGIVVLGVVLLLRAELISFGHGLYYAVGAYLIAYFISEKIITDIAILVPLSAVCGGTFAALTGLLLQRYRGIFFAMLSLAFSMIAYTLLLKFYAFTGGTDGISIQRATLFGFGISAETKRMTFYFIVLAVTAMVLFAAWRFQNSPLGYFTSAVRYNEIRVRYLGASPERSIYVANIFSGALGGIGGCLVALNIGHVDPDFAYWTTSGDFVFVAVLGGVSSIFGAFAGSFVFEFLKNYAFKISPNTWQMTLGIVMLLIIFYSPEGIWGFRRQLTRTFGRWARSSKRAD